MKTLTFSIASATTGDCDECARLLAEQLGEHGIEASAGALSSVLEKVVGDSARGFVLLARDESRIVGVAYVATILSMEHGGLVGWLEELYVTPDLRSQGIGTALLTAILERAAKMAILAIDLEVDSGHRRAESLYRKFDFRPLDRSRWVRKLQRREA